MATKKVTKRDYFTMLKDVVGNAEIDNKENIIAFLDHEIELLNRKTAKSGPTKNQIENEATKGEILEILAAEGNPITATEVAAKVGLTSQKVSALLTQLVKVEKKVIRTEDKKRAYFSLAA